MTSQSSGWSRWLALSALTVALVSLALNGYFLWRMNQVRVNAIDTLYRVESNLDALSSYTLHTNVRVNEIIPVNGEIPINMDLMAPISTSVPIKTTFSVNVSTPLGAVQVPINIDQSFPVNLTVPVHLDQRLPFTVQVPLAADLPVEVRLTDTEGTDLIQAAKTELRRLRQGLE